VPSGDTPGFSTPTGRDLSLVNADIITLDPHRPAASAALVRDGRIVLVGDAREVRSQAGNAPEYDAGGRVVIPGFVDNHCHVEDSCVVGDEQPTLHGLKSISEMVGKVRSVASRTPKGEWVLMQAVASDFPNDVAEKRWLNRQDLDEATQEHPVMVVLGIHASILNTRGWKETGYWELDNERNVLWKGDGTPRMGSIIQRDESGHPSGLATEVWDFRPGYKVEQYKASLQRHFREWFLSKGLTSIVTIQDTSPNEFLALQTPLGTPVAAADKFSTHSIRGFKFHPPLQQFFANDPLAYPLYEAIAEARLPALFHTGHSGIGTRVRGGGGVRQKYGNPIYIDDVAVDFPDMPIIMAHPSFPWQDEAISVCLHKPQVYIDLSGWSPKYFSPTLVQYANTLLKDKVLFGSDFPVITPDRWLKDFESIGIKEECGR